MKWIKNPLTGLYLQVITHTLFTIGLFYAFHLWLAFALASAVNENPDTLLERFMVRGFPFFYIGIWWFLGWFLSWFYSKERE